MGRLNSSNSPSLTIAGRIFTDLANLKVLTATSIGANKFSDFLDTGAAAPAAYTPSGALKFRAYAVRLLYRGVAVASSEHGALLYSDAAVGESVAAAGANPKYYGLNTTIVQSSSVGVIALQSAGLQGSMFYEQLLNWVVPNTKIPQFKSVAADYCNVQLFGYEE